MALLRREKAVFGDACPVQRNPNNCDPSRAATDYIACLSDFFRRQVKPWEPVFVASGGTGQPIYDSWKSTGQSCTMRPDDLRVPCGCTWKSYKVDVWEELLIGEVRVEFYKNKRIVAFAEFNATDSTKMNWFSPERLGANSWTDLNPNNVTATTNIFSLGGDPNTDRRFFISAKYGGCPNDRLWMVIVDRRAINKYCPYDQASGTPRLYYAPGNTRTSGSSLGTADQMAIFVR
ncbi:uncharacterized protein LOC141900458 isoform X2 [Tubulanus polymorphus]|uniref:uncharacterized protein LOC141900458 isoform X2 n=1 Tax=Tubulanus polymorphus TaxID=672921 RepID=UPI003DA32BF5